MTSVSSSKNKYDTIVIGAGLTGLLVAWRLTQLGQKVLVLEAKETAGGHLNRTITKGHSFHSSLEFVPDFKEYTENLDLIGEWLGLNILGPARDSSAKTYQSGEFRDFVGFGDAKIASLDEVQWYTQAKTRELLVSPEDVIARLLTEPKFEIQTLHEVTGYVVEGGLAKAATINGAKNIEADSLIHTAPIAQLTHLFADSALKPKEKSRLAKAHAWTSVCLHFLHRGLQSDSQDLHILLGTKTEPEPCLGRFFQAQTQDGSLTQESLWMSFIDPEMAEDMESLGTQIRNMKKQIKKAYPELLETVQIEKISVTPESHGFIELSLKSPLQLSGIDGFWLASPLLFEQRGIGSSVQAAVAVLAHMMGGSVPHPEAPASSTFTEITL